MVQPVCYLSMNREPGATPSLEEVHECGKPIGACPNRNSLDAGWTEYNRSRMASDPAFMPF